MNVPLRVLVFACVELEAPTGPTIHTINLLRGWHERDGKIRFVGPRPRRAPAIACPFPCGFVPFFGFGPFRSFLFSALSFLYLLREVLIFAPHVIYARYADDNPSPALVALLTNTLLVLQVNGPFCAQRLGALLPFRVARGFVFNSTGLRDRLCAEYDIPPARTCVMSMHVDTRRFQPRPREECRRSLGIPMAAFVLGYVGSFNPTHEIQALFPALEWLIAQGRDARLLLIGDGSEHAACRAAAQRSAVSSRITFAGFVPNENLPAYMGAFDVGVALLKPEKAYATEAFVKLKEYLACGVPAVVNPCAPELFGAYPERSVFLSPSFDPAELGATVLAAARGDCAELRDIRRAFIERRFGIGEAARQTEEFLRAAWELRSRERAARAGAKHAA